MSETGDWADEIAAQLVTLHDAEECGQWMIANRPAVAAALRKERENTVERCAVVAHEITDGFRNGKDHAHELITTHGDRIEDEIRATLTPRGE